MAKKLKVSKQCYACDRVKLLKDFDKKQGICKRCNQDRNTVYRISKGSDPYDTKTAEERKSLLYTNKQRSKLAREALTELTE